MKRLQATPETLAATAAAAAWCDRQLNSHTKHQTGLDSIECIPTAFIHLWVQSVEAIAIRISGHDLLSLLRLYCIAQHLIKGLQSFPLCHCQRAAGASLPYEHIYLIQDQRPCTGAAYQTALCVCSRMCVHGLLCTFFFRVWSG